MSRRRRKGKTKAVEKATTTSIVGRGRKRPVGGTGTMINAGFITSEEYNSDVRGSKWYGDQSDPGIAHEMMRDPHVRASVEFVLAALVGTIWKFRPRQRDPSPLDLEIADYCSRAFLEQIPFKAIVRFSARAFIKSGFGFGEMTDDTRPIPVARFPLHPGGGFGVVPTGILHRPEHTIWKWNQKKKAQHQLASIEQMLPPSDSELRSIVKIPSNRLIRWTYDQEGSDFQGIAPLRSCYQPWKLKQAFTLLKGIKHERLAVGTPVWTLAEDANDEDIDNAQLIMAEMRSHEKSWVILPNGSEFKWEGATQTDGTNIDLAIQVCDEDIAWNMLAGYLRLGQGKTGSYALATTSQGIFHMSVEGYANFWADAFNFGSDGWSPIKRIVELNYGPDAETPILVPANLPTHDWKSLIPEIDRMVSKDVIRPDDKLEAEVREMLTLGPADVATARRIRGTFGVLSATEDEADLEEPTNAE